MRLVGHLIFKDGHSVNGSTVLKVFLNFLCTSGIMDILNKNTPCIPLVLRASWRFTILAFFGLLCLRLLLRLYDGGFTYILIPLGVFAIVCIELWQLLQILTIEVYYFSWIL